MYCPQCGEQQLLEIARFCCNCGFSLSQVRHFMHNGGATAKTATGSELQQNAEIDTITFPVPTPIEDIEKGMIISTLNKMKGNKTRAAELLGISLKTLHNKLSEYRRP